MTGQALDDMISIEQSGLFDADWYSATYPDVRLSGLSALEHFTRIGRRIGRHASASAASLYGEDKSGVSATVSPVSDRAVHPHISKDTRDAIARTRLFNERWYKEQYGDVIRFHDDLLSDYLSSFEADICRDPGPLFSTSFYTETHQDLCGVHPLVHFALHGIGEGRAAFSTEKTNNFLQEAALPAVAPLPDILDIKKETVVLHWKEGNFFFSEIAEYTVTYLQTLGFRAKLRHDATVKDLKNTNLVIVAPHEFCVYGPGKDWSQQELGRAVYLNTEQWHTGWFSLSFGFLIKSGMALDINPSSAAGLVSLGIRAGFIPLLPQKGSCFFRENHAVSDALTSRKVVTKLTYPSDFEHRPYDALFVGVLNSRRAKALANLAPVLQDYNIFLHAPEFNRPVRPNDPDMIGNGDLAQLARNSKILINIHQGESHYFEWHRLFLSGIMEGCVVVTEKCISTGVVRPGDHYIETNLDDMPKVLEFLLSTDDGRQTMEVIHRNCTSLRASVDFGELEFV